MFRSPFVVHRGGCLVNLHRAGTVKKCLILPLAVILMIQPAAVYAQNGLKLAHAQAQLQKSEYYLMGYESAREQYRGYGAIMIGFPTGVFLFIGPFIGAGVSSFVPVRVPEENLSHINPENQPDYKSGYTQYVRNNRFKKMFLSGMVCSAVISSCCLVVIVYVRSTID